MHGADEFLCRSCVILKCETVALVGHRTVQLSFTRSWSTRPSCMQHAFLYPGPRLQWHQQKLSNISVCCVSTQRLSNLRSGTIWVTLSFMCTFVAPSRGTQRLFSSLMLLQPHKPARADAIWALAMEKPQFVLDCGPLIHLIPCTAIVRTRIMEKRSLSYGYTGTSSKRMTQQRRAGGEQVRPSHLTTT